MIANKIKKVKKKKKNKGDLIERQVESSTIPEWQKKLNEILPSKVGPLVDLDRMINLHKIFSLDELILIVNEIYYTPQAKAFSKTYGLPGILALANTKSEKGLNVEAAKKALEVPSKLYSRRSTTKFGENLITLRGVISILEKGARAHAPKRHQNWIANNHYNALWDFYKSSIAIGKDNRIRWLNGGLNKIGDIEQNSDYPAFINNKIVSFKSKINKIIDLIKKAKDVAIIVGRPSYTLQRRESRKEKVEMETWRAAANALATEVFEGLTLELAFQGLKNEKFPLGTLYVISHGVFGEIDPETGNSRLRTTSDIIKSIKSAIGNLESRKPHMVYLLSCYGGTTPEKMMEIGKTLEAPAVLAPAQETVISGRIVNITKRGRTRRLTKKMMRRMSDKALKEYVEQIDALKYYDFVPGVPHIEYKELSKEEKLNELVKVLRKNGLIPFVSINAVPGTRDAKPYWKVKTQKRQPGEKISDIESLIIKDVIKVEVPER